MKDQKKRKGFYAYVRSCSCPLSHFRARHPFHMGGFSIASESRLFPWVHSPPTGYSSGHPWRLVSVSLSQCCRVILSDLPNSLKIICLTLTRYPVLRTSPLVSVQLWLLHHLPLFRVDWWRIHQGLPSTDFFLSTSTHYPGTKSKNLSLFWYLGNHFSSLVVFLVAVSGFHYWSLLSRFLSCSTSSSFIHMGRNVPGLMALKTLGYQKTLLLSSLLPGCDRSYVSLTLVYISIIDPQCTWSWLWSSSCGRSTLYVWWLHLSWFILSWIHTVFLVAMTLLMESSMDLQCITGSYA